MAAATEQKLLAVWTLFLLAFVVSTVLVLHEAVRLAFPPTGSD
jgi:hypothetical protein